MIDAMAASHELRRQSLSTLLRRAAARYRDRVALVCGEDQWSYRVFDQLVDRLCNGLTAAGVTRGERIAIIARNSHAWMAVRFAVARAGAVLVPVNFALNRCQCRSRGRDRWLAR